MISFLFFTILAVAFVGIKIQECTSAEILCPENQQYVPCVNPCNNCRDRGICSFTHSCKKGCDCNTGYYKNAKGRCVLEKFCDSNAAGHCFFDEEFLECGCVLTCCNVKQYNPCASQCFKGCFCRKGLVRDKFGRCIKPEDCPKEPQTTPASVTCGPNSHYENCASICQPTCSNPNPTCGSKCKPKCVCNHGYILFLDICIKKEQCPTTTSPCPAITCPGGCKIDYNAKPCPVCKCYTTTTTTEPTPGTVRCPAIACPDGCTIDYNAKPCVVCDCTTTTLAPVTLPRVTCGPNAYHKECALVCQPTCSNPKPRCSSKCRPMCVCNPGYILLLDICIKEEECPIRNCGPFENSTYCVNPCNDCKIRGKCVFDKCDEGCDCIHGYYRDEYGKCIPEAECTSDVYECGEDEEYYINKPDCRRTCDNFDDILIECPVEEPGCFCKRFLVKRKDGKCIKSEECPHDCGKNEFYRSCGQCDRTCENKEPICQGDCRRACFCLGGFARSQSGECIPEKECPPIYECDDEDEEYYDYKPDCRNTCDNFDAFTPCPIGRPGCFCKEGLVKRKDGKCVPPTECPDKECGKNEVYTSCGFCGDPTCGNGPVCQNYCSRVCLCLEGFVRSLSGECIPENECHLRCAEDEVYYIKFPVCKKTCDHFDDPEFECPVAYTGCFCKPGLVKSKDGKCIPSNECPDKECGINEVYVPCGYCEPTCDTKNPNCPHYCKRVCLCLDGLVRSQSGECIPENECIPSCGPNEEKSKCVKPPWCNSCKIKGNCTIKHCLDGCECKPGYYRDINQVCIPEWQCPGCGKNEELVDCVLPDWCNTCSVKGDCKRTGCVQGCDCKPKHYRDLNGTCIPEYKCPNCTTVCDPGCYFDYSTLPCPTCVCPTSTTTCMKKDEQYYEHVPSCKNNCEAYFNPEVDCATEPPGCFCKEGLIKRKDGNCVKPEDC